MRSLSHTTSSFCLGARERGPTSHFIAKAAGVQSGDRAWWSEGACSLSVAPGAHTSKHNSLFAK